MKILTKLFSFLWYARFFHCNCCGAYTLSFKNGWGDFICLSCGSSTRSRLLLASLQYLEEFSYMQLLWNKSILHCAPEKSTSKYIGSHSSSYTKADYEVSRYKDSRFIDLNIENPGYSASSFDCIICFDVLEHVPSTSNALIEIYRLLKDGGCFISSVPIPFGLSLSVESSIDQQSKPNILQRIFGFSNHLRMFGIDYEAILQKYFRKVELVTSNSFQPSLQRKHMLISKTAILKPLATRHRRIFFAYK